METKRSCHCQFTASLRIFNLKKACYKSKYKYKSRLHCIGIIGDDYCKIVKIKSFLIIQVDPGSLKFCAVHKLLTLYIPSFLHYVQTLKGLTIHFERKLWSKITYLPLDVINKSHAPTTVILPGYICSWSTLQAGSLDWTVRHACTVHVVPATFYFRDRKHCL